MEEEIDRVAGDDKMVEVRFHASPDDVGVVDAIVQAERSDRGVVMRRLLSEFVAQKLHESTLVLRVARINPIAPDSGRKGGGK